jgi:hypothetical protein
MIFTSPVPAGYQPQQAFVCGLLLSKRRYKSLAQSFTYCVFGLAAHLRQHVAAVSSVMEMEACPSSYRTNIALERQRGAGVPEAVEGDPRQHRPLQERRVGPMARVEPGG